jgi:flagellar basal-body rod protein FlgG
MAGDFYEVTNAADRLVTRLESVTNNLANASTIGFKAEFLHYLAQAELAGNNGEGSATGNRHINMNQGTIQQTGNALDIAINGEGFFAVQTKDGESYTRKGNFSLNRNGEIITSTGEIVLGDTGPIVAKGKDIQIDQTGMVSVDGAQVGRLKIVAFDKPNLLEKIGNGVYSAAAAAGMKVKSDPDLISNAVEMSNVNAVEEMVTMIEIQRTMEIYQKLILTISEQDKISTSRIGKLV